MVAHTGTRAAAGGVTPALGIQSGLRWRLTHATISNALIASLAAGADEIRIARNQTYTNLYIHLTDWSPGTVGAVTLAGGYDTCADTTASGTTTIDGQATNPVVEVDTGSQPTSQVTLRNLLFIGSGEEGLRVGAGGQVTASEILLQFNGTGGAAVVDGGDLVIDTLSTISDNTGPGITCLTGSQVDTSASIRDNSATAGGGIVAGSTCDMNILHNSAISANNATLGGGIYASSGATVLVDGAVASVYATEIADNTATDQGGGIYATGATTTILIRNAAVTGNEAGLEGGGIWAGLGAKVIMDRVDGPCFSPARCSDLSGNGVTQSNQVRSRSRRLGGERRRRRDLPDHRREQLRIAELGQRKCLLRHRRRFDADRRRHPPLEQSGGRRALRRPGLRAAFHRVRHCLQEPLRWRVRHLLRSR